MFFGKITDFYRKKIQNREKRNKHNICEPIFTTWVSFVTMKGDEKRNSRQRLAVGALFVVCRFLLSQRFS